MTAPAPHLVDGASKAMRELLRRVAVGQLTAADAMGVLADWPDRGAEIERLRDDLERAYASIHDLVRTADQRRQLRAAALALHVAVQPDDEPYPYCKTCEHSYPCATRAALGAADEPTTVPVCHACGMGDSCSEHDPSEPTTGGSEHEVCGLCGHVMLRIETCGSALVWDGDRRVPLCHTDDHDCYHRWTVYGDRPGAGGSDG